MVTLSFFLLCLWISRIKNSSRWTAFDFLEHSHTYFFRYRALESSLEPMIWIWFSVYKTRDISTVVLTLKMVESVSFEKQTFLITTIVVLGWVLSAQTLRQGLECKQVMWQMVQRNTAKGGGQKAVGRKVGTKQADTVGSGSWGHAPESWRGKEAAVLVIACFHPSLAEGSGQGHFRPPRGIMFAVQCCSYVQERWVPRERGYKSFSCANSIKPI